MNGKNGLIKIAAMAFIAIFFINSGFCIERFYEFANMNGILSMLDGIPVSSIPIRMNCSVVPGANKTFYASTNSNGFFSFEGQGDYFSTQGSYTSVNCALWSTDSKVINNNPIYSFQITQGDPTYAGITQNLIYNIYSYCENLPSPIINQSFYNYQTFGKAPLIAISMEHGTSCTVNGISMSKNQTTGFFQRGLSYDSSGTKILDISCTNTCPQTRITRFWINIDADKPIIAREYPQESQVVGLSSMIQVSTNEQSSCTATFASTNYPMQNSNNIHSAQISGFSNGTNSISISCIDNYQNLGTYQMQITADTIPPQVLSIMPEVDSINPSTGLFSGIQIDTDKATSCILYNSTNSWQMQRIEQTNNFELNDFNFMNGVNSFQLNCTDSLNNELLMHGFSINADGVSPSMELLYPLENDLSGKIAIVNISAIDVSGINSCWLNGTLMDEIEGIYQQSISGLINGTNMINASCIDIYGNFNQTFFQIMADTIGPQINFLNPQNNSQAGADFWVNATTNEQATCSARIAENYYYDATFENMLEHSFWLSSLQNGPNEIIMNCTDAYGNENESSIIINVNPLNIELIYPINPTNDNMTYANITTNNANYCDLSIDEIFYPMNKVEETNDFWHKFDFELVEGKNEIAINCSNQNDEFEDKFNITIDLTLPEIEIISLLNGFNYSTQIHWINLTIADEHFESLWFNVDDGENQTYYDNETNVPFDFGSDGSKTLNVWANDSAGNINHASISFLIDTELPYIEIILPQNIFYNESMVPIEIIASDNNHISNAWIFNGTQNITYYEPSMELYFEDGEHELIAYANDTSGNLNSTSVSFIVDTAAPLMTIIHPENNSFLASRNQWINITIDDANNDSIWYEWNGTIVLHQGNEVFDFVDFGDEGIKELNIWANDSAGNVNHSYISFTVDAQFPSIDILSPENNALYNYSPQWINITIDDANPSSIWFNVNDGENNTFYANEVSFEDFDFGEDGQKTLNVWANDSAGNANYSFILFEIDTKFPMIEKIFPEEYINSTISYIIITSDEPALCYLNGTEMNNSDSLRHWIENYAFDENALNYFNASCIDLAGNYNETFFGITSDTLAPTIQIIHPETEGLPLGSDVYFEINAQDEFGIDYCEVSINNTWNYSMNNNENNYTYIAQNVPNNYYESVFSCKDYAGNINFTDAIFFEVNGEYDAISIDEIFSPINESNYTYFPSLNFTTNNDIEVICNYSLNGAQNITLNSTGNNYFADDLQYNQMENNISISCHDKYNSDYTFLEIMIDSINPQSQMNDIAIINSPSFELSGIFFDEESGIANVTYYYNGTNNLINSSSIAPYNFSWEIPLEIENTFINLTAIAYDNFGNSNISEIKNIPVNAINDAPMAILNLTNTEIYEIKILNASQSHDTDSAVIESILAYNYLISNDSINFYSMSSCDSQNNSCEWNIEETENICIYGQCFLKVNVSDDIHEISSNVESLNISGNDLRVLSLDIPNEIFVGQSYKINSTVKNAGQRNANINASIYDNGNLRESKLLILNAGESINLTYDIDFSHGNRNITIIASAANEMNPIDNSLTSFLNAQYAIEKMDISVLMPSQANMNSTINATIYVYNPLDFDYNFTSLPNFNYSLPEGFNPSYHNFTILNHSQKSFKFEYTLPGIAGTYAFWANNSLQLEGYELPTENKTINVRNPNSPIMSVDLAIVPKISPNYNSTAIAYIYNYGNETAYNANATINVPEGVILFGSPTIQLGEIENGTYKVAEWELRGEYAGDFEISINVEVDDYEDEISKTIEPKKPIISHTAIYDNSIYNPSNLTLTVLLNNTGANANVNVSLVLDSGIYSNASFKLVQISNNTLNDGQAVFEIGAISEEFDSKSFKIIISEPESNYYEEEIIVFSRLPDPVMNTQMAANSANQTTSILISWDAIVNAARYQIERSTSESGAYSFLNETTNINHNDFSISNNTDYYYRVRAFNELSQPGNYSNIVYGRINSIQLIGGNGGNEGNTNIIIPPADEPEENQSEEFGNESQIMIAQEIDFSGIEKISQLLGLKEKLSVQLLKSNYEKYAQTNDPKYLNEYNKILSQTSFSQEQDSSSSKREANGFEIMTNASVSKTIMGNQSNARHDVYRTIRNNSNQTIYNQYIYFEIPLDAIPASEFDSIDSKAMIFIESLMPGEEIIFNYSFLTKSEYDIFADAIEITSELRQETGMITGFIALASSNKEAVIYSLAGIIILSSMAMLYLLKGK